VTKLKIMAKQEVLTFTGVVLEVLPNALFRVELDGEWVGTVVMLCHISGRMIKNHINILKDDIVQVEVAPNLPMEKGRIVFREKR
jgi:translation initiation factor IF-1